MATKLTEIVEATRRRVEKSKRAANLRTLELEAERHLPRGFRRHLDDQSRERFAVIAELKKASPSRGLIRAEFHAERLAREFEIAGATALSVLTEEQYFEGSLDNLRRASAATALPCLRKDFMVDEWQMLEARAHSADAILLIVAALSPAEFARLLSSARQTGLDALCEVHDERELKFALDSGCDLVGVNSRDLKTFAVDLATAHRLAPLFPASVLSVAESGIQSGAELVALRGAGYRAFLMGESLMKADSPGKCLEALLLEASSLEAGGTGEAGDISGKSSAGSPSARRLG
jgi:indole-3-glycerol phosphate synthase